MKTIIMAILLVSSGLASSAQFSYNASEFSKRHSPVEKLTENIAETSCQTLSRLTLDSQSAYSITLKTKPKIGGVAVKDQNAVIVMYPYRSDGVNFVCLFKDYGKGRLQLLSFGHSGSDIKDDVMTNMNLLY